MSTYNLEIIKLIKEKKKGAKHGPMTSNDNDPLNKL